jgi:hypothetical protein
MATNPKLTPWQINYIRRAVKLRRQLSVKAMAARFGVSESTVDGVANGRYKYVNQEGAIAAPWLKRGRTVLFQSGTHHDVATVNGPVIGGKVSVRWSSGAESWCDVRNLTPPKLTGQQRVAPRIGRTQ